MSKECDGYSREEAQFRVEFLKGKIDGIRDYAIWKNGDQFVGCLEKPLREVLDPYQKEIEALVEAHNL
jgi:hypothetical protein